MWREEQGPQKCSQPSSQERVMFHHTEKRPCMCDRVKDLGMGRWSWAAGQLRHEGGRRASIRGGDAVMEAEVREVERLADDALLAPRMREGVPGKEPDEAGRPCPLETPERARQCDLDFSETRVRLRLRELHDQVLGAEAAELAAFAGAALGPVTVSSLCRSPGAVSSHPAPSLPGSLRPAASPGHTACADAPCPSSRPVLTVRAALSVPGSQRP